MRTLTLLVATGLVAASSPALAQTFSEGTFASSTLTLTDTFETGESSISVGQCLHCGNPDSALRFVLDYPDDGASSVALGVVLNNFFYDPGTQGAIGTVTIGAQKKVDTNIPVTFTNTIRPLIQQGGNYYLASIPLGSNTGPGSTGWLTGSGTFNASAFTLYDFTTGSFGVGNPNFASGVIKFGFGQIGNTTLSGITRVTYDNLSVDISRAPTVPEPATWGLMILGFGVVGGAMRRRARVQALAA